MAAWGRVVAAIQGWCAENLEGETFNGQVTQMVEEMGELSDTLKTKAPHEEVCMEAGDVGVVWISMCRTIGVDPLEALAMAEAKNRDREGEMVDGRLVKEEDR